MSDQDYDARLRELLELHEYRQARVHRLLERVRARTDDPHVRAILEELLGPPGRSLDSHGVQGLREPVSLAEARLTLLDFRAYLQGIEDQDGSTRERARALRDALLELGLREPPAGSENAPRLRCTNCRADWLACQASPCASPWHCWVDAFGNPTPEPLLRGLLQRLRPIGRAGALRTALIREGVLRPRLDLRDALGQLWLRNCLDGEEPDEAWQHTVRLLFKGIFPITARERKRLDRLRQLFVARLKLRASRDYPLPNEREVLGLRDLE